MKKQILLIAMLLCLGSFLSVSAETITQSDLRNEIGESLEKVKIKISEHEKNRSSQDLCLIKDQLAQISQKLPDLQYVDDAKSMLNDVVNTLQNLCFLVLKEGFSIAVLFTLLWGMLLQLSRLICLLEIDHIIKVGPGFDAPDFYTC